MHPLLFPRILVIDKYPDSIFKPGQVLIFVPDANTKDFNNTIWFTNNSDGLGGIVTHSLDYFFGFDKLFRRMFWHEQRSEEEIYSIQWVQKNKKVSLPTVGDEEILAATSWAVFSEWPEHFAVGSTKYSIVVDRNGREGNRYNLGHFEPRTAAQYHAYADTTLAVEHGVGFEDMYQTKIMEHNETILRSLNSPSAVADFAFLCADVEVDGLIKIVSTEEVKGDEQPGISFNIFFESYIHEQSICFNNGINYTGGIIYARYTQDKWLQIPFKHKKNNHG